MKIRVLFITLILLSSCSPKLFKEHWVKKQAPQVYKARFETSKGTFDIEAHRKWSPKGVDRLYQLITSEFYTDIALFRVVPNFVAQFGIHNNTALQKAWENFTILDEPIIEENTEGTISFARSGKNSRATQLFINLKSNSPRLDTITYKDVKGFPVIAKVINGMNTVKSFYNNYSEEPGRKGDSIQRYGNTYLKKHFPKLDYIKRAYIIK